MQELTINQTAQLTGVTVRTLHHYHHIGLLVPQVKPENSYRYYTENDLARLQQILFLKELDFPLNDIGKILDSPNFDPKEALIKQRHLLLLKQQHTESLINLIDKTIKGDDIMSFNEFNKTDIKDAQEQYKKEAMERWGNTEAYAESAKRTASYSKADWQKINDEASEIYKAFASNINLDPSTPLVQELVATWQGYITKNFYNCTKEILAGLGQMYTADERFTQNIDKYGTGLAAFMSKAIAIYCK